MYDRPVSIISDLVAGIKSLAPKSLVQSLSKDSAHMNWGLLPFIGGFQKKNLKDCKKCINMVKLLPQNPILKEMLSNADYSVCWKIPYIKSAPNKTCFTIISKTFCRLVGALLVFHLNKIEKNLQCYRVLWFYFPGFKKMCRHKCFYMILLKISFKIIYQMAYFMSLGYQDS